MPDFSMELPLTRSNFREDLKDFVKAEMRGEFEAVLRSQMQNELSTFFRFDKGEQRMRSDIENLISTATFGGIEKNISAMDMQVSPSLANSDISDCKRQLTAQGDRTPNDCASPAASDCLVSWDLMQMRKEETGRSNLLSPWERSRGISQSLVLNASGESQCLDYFKKPKSRNSGMLLRKEGVTEILRSRNSSILSKTASNTEMNSRSRIRSDTIRSSPIPEEATDFREDSLVELVGKHDQSGPLLASQAKARIAMSAARRCIGMVSGIMVLLNALIVGLETNHRLLHDGQSAPYALICEPAFCVFFVGEIALRIYMEPASFYSFFCGKLRYWNIFDFSIVALQVIEQSMFIVGAFGQMQGFAALRLLRVLRIVRVVRLVRVVHLFDQLRIIVASMVNSCGVLLWSLVMLFLVVYFFSVTFLQFILDSGNFPEFKNQEEMQRYYISLPRTILTMFESVVGGVNWDDAVTPLMTNISPALGFLFCIYVAVAVFAIMNMLTGVFVDRAMQCIRDDKDFIVANQIRDLFLPDHYEDEDEDDAVVAEIDWYTFQEKMQSRAMQGYLLELGVSSTESGGLFDLLDEDANGSLSSHEIITGCLRLRAAPTVLDLALLMREVNDLRADLRGIKTSVDRSLGLLGMRGLQGISPKTSL